MTLGKTLDETTIKFALAAHAEFVALQQRGMDPVDALQITVCASMGAAISTFRSIFFNHNIPFGPEHQDMLRKEPERQFTLPISLTDTATGKPIVKN
jgi:hypothetical protein